MSKVGRREIKGRAGRMRNLNSAVKISCDFPVTVESVQFSPAETVAYEWSHVDFPSYRFNLRSNRVQKVRLLTGVFLNRMKD
jgi:hypothetical protein